MTRLVVTANASADMEVILEYLETAAGPTTAANYAELFRATLARLTDFPRSGPPRPALGPFARIAIVYPYILIYDFIETDDTLTLQRVIHGKRNITRRLLASSDEGD